MPQAILPEEDVTSKSPSKLPDDKTKPRHKLLREIKSLQTSYNPISLEDILHTNLLPAEFMFNVNDESYPEEAPKNYKSMIKLRDMSWLQAHESELQNFITRKAWKVLPRSSLPTDKRTLKTRFVYRIKSDGTKKARCVIKGYEQIPGIDFHESFSPLATDTTIRIVLVLSLHYAKLQSDWVTEVIDVEAAFLNAEVDQDIYIEIPEGLREYKQKKEGTDLGDSVVKLLRAQYGLVQSPRLWMNTFSNILIDLGMRQCKTDPCLFIFPISGDPKCIILVYCDDCIMTGTALTVKKLKLGISKKVNITEIGTFSRHLGVDWKFGTDDDGDYLESSMISYVNSICKDLEAFINKPLKLHDTPGPSHTCLMKNENQESIKNLDEYRSFVGRLLFMARKTDPYSLNAIRELSAHLSSPTEVHWKSLLHLAGYLKGHYSSLKLRLPTTLQVTSFVDSDYASDKNDRKSISGYLTTIGGSLVSWHSKKQNSITLSSTEAEYVAMSSATSEIKFVTSVIEEILGKPPPLPSLLYEDNTGAIFMAKNIAVGQRTKHVDIRTRFTNDMVKNGKLKIIFIRSADNPADGMTKNLPSALHSKHFHTVYGGMLKKLIEDHQSREDVNNNECLCSDDPQSTLCTDQGWITVGTGKKG